MEGSQRRLAAILAADMVGFSRLIEADEEGTLARQKALRTELVDPTVQDHHGRIVKSTGDGFLAEFGSAVDALRCAVRIQSAIRDGQVAAASGDPSIVYRMGINVGDIVIDGDDILGDGVNIAARLEGEADPGGICVSRGVFDHVKGKVEVRFEDLGKRALKNIAEPIQVFGLRFERETAPQEHIRSARLDKPSIAVLPIANISGSPDLDPLAAGLTEDLVAALARIPELSVVPRNATEAFAGKAVEARQVARQLSVANVLEGSVQGSVKRLRVTVQLIDGVGGTYLWAGRYDSEGGDILALQDDIVRKALIEVRVKLSSGDHARIDGRGTRDLNAWLLCGQGFDEWAKFTRHGNFRARELFQAAFNADPGWARPLAALSATYRESAIRGWGTSPERDLAHGVQLAERAVELDPDDPMGYIRLGYFRATMGLIDEGITLLEKAVELAPNDASSMTSLAWNLPRIGEYARALAMYERARQVRQILSAPNLQNEAFVLHLAGRHERAIETLRACIKQRDMADAHVRLAAIHAEFGRLEEAHAEIAHVLARKPDATIKEYTGNLPFPDGERLEWYTGLLRAAGLPDG